MKKASFAILTRGFHPRLDGVESLQIIIISLYRSVIITTCYLCIQILLYIYETYYYVYFYHSISVWPYFDHVLTPVDSEVSYFLFEHKLYFKIITCKKKSKLNNFIILNLKNLVMFWFG